MPLLTTAEVLNLVFEQLNVAKTTYGTFDGSPLYKLDGIKDTVMLGDIEVVKTIIRTPGHPRRPEFQFVTSAILTPGVNVPIRDTFEHAGELLRVMITRQDDVVVVGKTVPSSKISQWLLDKSSYGGDDIVDGYYDYTNDLLIFTGKSATLTLTNVGEHTTADVNLFSPSEYKMAIVHYACKELLRRDPAKTAEQALHESAWGQEMQLLTGFSVNPPESVTNQKVRG